MTIHTETCYWVVCDLCGNERSGSDVEILHFPTSGDAVSNATDSDWIADGEFHWCVDCEDMGKVICVCGGRWYEHGANGQQCEGGHLEFGKICVCTGWRRVLVAKTVGEIAKMVNAGRS